MVTASVPRGTDRAAPLVLLAFAVLLFPAATLQGRVFFERDLHLVWYAQVQSFLRAVRGGSWPLWDPWVGFGQPMLANPNAQVLYPFTWLHLLVPPPTVYTLYVVLHVAASGEALRRLARAAGLSPAGALAAGLAWCASGPLLSLVSVWHHLAGACWMPAVLLAAWRTLERPSLRRAAVWGAAQAAQLLAGSPDMVLLTAAATAWSAFLTLAPAGAPRGPWLRAAAAAVATAVLLSALQWLPALEVARRSARAALPEEARTYWSVHPVALPQLAWPVRLAALPLQGPARDALFEGREPFLPSLYLGGVALALAVAALAARERHGALWGTLAGVALLVALGRHTPVYTALTTLVPPLRMVRYPEKAMVLVALGTAFLAGRGFERVHGGPRRRTAALLGAVATSALGLAAACVFWPDAVGALALAREPAGPTFRDTLAPVAGSLGAAAACGTAALLAARAAATPWAVCLLLAALATDLGLAHARLSPTAAPEFYRYRPAAAAAVDQRDLSRLHVYEYAFLQGRSRQLLGRDTPYRIAWTGSSPPPREVVALARRHYFAPPVGAAWGLFSSFDVDLLDMAPRPLARLTEVLDEADGTPHQTSLLRLGAVSQVLSLHPLHLTGLEEVAQFPGFYREPVRLHRVSEPLPRAYAVASARGARGDEAAALLEPGFDPRRELLVEGEPVAVTPAPSPGRVQVRHFAADHVVLEADLAAPGWVVLVDGFDPGWRATVDGVPATVHRANVGFRAVRCPPGSHTVAWTYRPWTVTAGALASVAGLVLTGALVGRPADPA